jgi:hypothetical protein
MLIYTAQNSHSCEIKAKNVIEFIAPARRILFKNSKRWEGRDGYGTAKRGRLYGLANSSRVYKSPEAEYKEKHGVWDPICRSWL